MNKSLWLAFALVLCATAAEAQRYGRGSGPSPFLNPGMGWSYFERAVPPTPLIDPTFHDQRDNDPDPRIMPHRWCTVDFNRPLAGQCTK